MAEPFAGPDGMVMVLILIAAPHPRASLRWVCQGLIQRTLFNLIYRLRKKYLVKASIFLCFTTTNLKHAESMGNRLDMRGVADKERRGGMV